jgi:hypothetical protein
MNAIKDFLLNKLAGRILVRLVASGAAALATGQLGFTIDLSPTEQLGLVTALSGLAHSALSWLKPRPKAPEAPAAEAAK